MYRVAALVLSAMALAPAVTAAQSPFVEAAERLDGYWAGENFALHVDSQRAQANLDPRRPFQWQRFLVKEVDGSKVVFTVGAELFEAIVEAETLKLSGTSFRGERVLQRSSSTSAE